MTEKDLKAKMRAAGVATDVCRWVEIPPDTILGRALARQGKPLGYWSVALPPGARVQGVALQVLVAAGIDVREVEFLGCDECFSADAQAVTAAQGTPDGWSGWVR